MKRFHLARGLVVLSALAVLGAACAEDGDGGADGQDQPAGEEGVILMGADGLLSDTFVAEPESTGMYFSGPGVPEGGEYEEFVSKYEEEYGEGPIAGFHAHAYDATNMLLDAIEDVAQEDGDQLTIERQALRDRLHETDFEGLTGHIVCDNFGDCADPSIQIFRKTQDGQSLSEITGDPLFEFETETELHAEGEPERGDPAQGSVTIGPDDPITIGALQAISGDVASLGTDQVRASEIAIADRDGQLLGHDIELQVEDDGCDAAEGQAGAERLVSDPQMIGVIGTSCSGAGVPASEVISGAGAVLISGSNTSPSLTSEGGETGSAWQPGYFRTAHNDEVQGLAAATFAFEELGVQTAASIHDGDPYTEGLAGVFDSSFTELGGSLALATAVNKGDTDMRPVLTEIQASGAELIFFPIFEPEGNFIAQQAQEVFGQVAGREGGQT